jgi:hypothetical protein
MGLGGGCLGERTVTTDDTAGDCLDCVGGLLMGLSRAMQSLEETDCLMDGRMAALRPDSVIYAYGPAPPPNRSAHDFRCCFRFYPLGLVSVRNAFGGSTRAMRIVSAY